jgi:hypothetical protein
LIVAALPIMFIHLITERCFISQELSVPLRTYLENFPKRKHLHPYERSFIELTFGESYYEQVLLVFLLMVWSMSVK